MAEKQKITTDYILEKIRESKINEKQLTYEEALNVVYKYVGKGNEKLQHQLRVEIAHFFRGDFQSIVAAAPSGNVHSGEDQTFVHSQGGIAVANDALLVAQSLSKGLA